MSCWSTATVECTTAAVESYLKLTEVLKKRCCHRMTRSFGCNLRTFLSHTVSAAALAFCAAAEMNAPSMSSRLSDVKAPDEKCSKHAMFNLQRRSDSTLSPAQHTSSSESTQQVDAAPVPQHAGDLGLGQRMHGHTSHTSSYELKVSQVGTPSVCGQDPCSRPKPYQVVKAHICTTSTARYTDTFDGEPIFIPVILEQSDKSSRCRP